MGTDELLCSVSSVCLAVCSENGRPSCVSGVRARHVLAIALRLLSRESEAVGEGCRDFRHWIMWR